ncbi:MAG: valine--tRNA ligase [Anaerolineae bacterium SM23_ 63]|nr:MAG: valine--tRNA ligase [Anaerolineae bacterium SM23_ 63]HEY45248.1 valine--tRNA ligase [Anaerolineae bacterium]
MSTKELSKAYDFKSVEKRLYDWWESRGYFKPRIDPNQKPYVISIPPPNVTGELHLGHAMFVAMEDLMIRHSRMKGVPTLWVPGTDHAGIATQLQVERHLQESEGITREELGREAFIERTWTWKRKFGGIITQQLRRLGASCDWERERFTLDEGLSQAVREAFVQLYEKGLIYRGAYLINWSPGLRTAVSDLEVEYSEEQGTLYYFRYPIADSEESIPVATTRPETILGDTAVAIHPDDKRYRHLIGKSCLVPILKRPIPVIEDSYVDLEFGTGALKITPGHDPNDYEIGQRHGLPIINVLNPDATMSASAGPYEGLDRYLCRDRLWSDMQSEGLTIKTEPYTMQVPRTQRGGEIVEPMVSTQWFVRMDPLAKPAIESVRQGQIRIVPERFTKVYYNWLENIRDWCISRQLWWGHRIPAWYCLDCGEITVTRDDPTQCAHCASMRIEQDPDVLDTWFSSGLWPFSTLGWPEETEDLRYFYPTSMMETGYDILFFWVARMVMMGLAFTNQPPFHTIYLHGLVRDEQGRKMSKTIGNVIDPLEVMDEFGTDALRFTLLTGSTPGNDMNLSLQRVEANRNFANKLWNAGRLVLMALDKAPVGPEDSPEPTVADRWIETRLNRLLRDVDRLFNNYQYAEAGRQIYEFFWGEFADWYLEIAKLQLDEGADRTWLTAWTMAYIFDTCLRLLHPFTPYVTEELWGILKGACQDKPSRYAPGDGWEEALIVAQWPEPPSKVLEEDQIVERFSMIMDLVRAIRNLRSERKVEPARQIAAIIVGSELTDLLKSLQQAIAVLAKLDPEQFQIHPSLTTAPPESVPLVVGPIEAYLPLAGMVDLAAERARLTKELDEVNEQITRIGELLAGPFSERAPKNVVEKERKKLASLEESADKITGQLKSLG